MEEVVLVVSHLSHAFGSRRVVNDVSLEVGRGIIYGLVGPDGAGKTTTLRLICGAFRIQAGSVVIAGYRMDERPEEVRAQIGYLSQRFSLYEDLTVLENIRFLAEVRGFSNGDWLERSRQNLAFVGLDAFENRLAGQLSGGMKQKLSLACALVNQPRLLLLDEPTTGVDPITRQDFWQLIIRLAGEQGVSVLLCTPYMDEASRCSRIGFMLDGKIICEGSPRELRQILQNRVLELMGSPNHLLRQLAMQNPAVEDAQRFGDRLHLRVKAGEHERVIAQLSEEIPRAGGKVDHLEVINPQLEDVFIGLTHSQALMENMPATGEEP